MLLRHIVGASLRRPTHLLNGFRGLKSKSKVNVGVKLLRKEVSRPFAVGFHGFASGAKQEGEQQHHEHVVHDDKTERPNVNFSDMTAFEKVKYVTLKYGTYAIVGGAFTYVVSKTSMYLTSTFMGLSFKTVGYYAFFAGWFSGLATGAGLYTVASRSFLIRPEHVRREAFRKVSHSAEVQKLMGVSMMKPLKAGVMRAYSLEEGQFAIDKNTRSLVYRHPRIKMLFQVYGGENNQAIVCAEAMKKGWSLQFDLISLDIITKPGNKPLIVEGNENRLEVDGQLRDLVQLKRRYV